MPPGYSAEIATSKNIEPETLMLITNIANTYGAYAEDMDIWLSVIYAGMIAEENKTFAILKKRIKRLGVFQTLMEHMAPINAAKFSLGRNWRDLDAFMKPIGFAMLRFK